MTNQTIHLAQSNSDTPSPAKEGTSKTASKSPSPPPTDAPTDELEAENPQTEDEKDEEAKFQAIGTLFGKIQHDEELGYHLRLGQNRYRLFILRNRYRAWLEQQKNSPDTPLFLRVYPKYRIIPRKPPEVYFQVVAWTEENQWSEPGIFTLRGIWQFIPQVRTPVISIYRNREAKDPTEKFKATHLPILMRREDDVRPFKFNPKIPKENLPSRWFVQVEVKFIPSRDCWGWVKDLDTPTEQIPRYKKPVKATDNPDSPPKYTEKSPENQSSAKGEENRTTQPQSPIKFPKTKNADQGSPSDQA